jgi:1-deoxy-D-xylulose-5-phosphate synthase
VDGHDEQALEHALDRARSFGGPVLVHCITRKGLGFAPAENDEADRFHGVGVIDPETGRPVTNGGLSWTSVFAEELVAIGHARPDVVAVTAAMLHPTGLAPFAEAFPDRAYDVGIAEQHAATSAAGLAFAGLHPVVAVYATFLNRAFDQVLLDVALHRAPVTFVLDRAGVTGDDGPSHNGIWDLSVFQSVPGLRIAAPRDGEELRRQLREAVDVADGPTIVRFPTGAVGPSVPAVASSGDCDILRQADQRDVLLVSVGAMATMCLEVADRLADQGVDVTVVDPRWVKPVSTDLVDLARQHGLVVTVEDNVRTGGVGSAVAQAMQDADVDVPVRVFGVPLAFLDHAKRASVLEECGLTAQAVSRAVVEVVARRDATSDEATRTEQPG